MGLWEFGRGTGKYTPVSTKTPRENTIVERAIREIKKEFKSEPIVVWKIHGSAYQRSGIPDVYVQIHGKAIWIEFKRPGADTTRLQVEKMTQLSAAGAYCGTAASPEEAIQLIKDALADC